MFHQRPVVVVPGILGSALRDGYPVGPRPVWGHMFPSLDRLGVHPEEPWREPWPARVVPDGVLPGAYGELIEELRHDLSPAADRPTPVYAFGYDWRRPLATAEEELADFLDEIVERTALLPHFRETGWDRRPEVDLVAHSMGGLVVAGALERYGDELPVGKVVSVAAPFRGSFEAAVKLATGLAVLGIPHPLSREREVARLIPALYHLLPSFPGAVDVDGDLEHADLYDPGLWQESVLATIAEHLRLHRMEEAEEGRREHAVDILAELLDEARTHRRRLESLDLARAGMSGVDWLCVVGVGEVTRIRLRIVGTPEGPWFDLAAGGRLNAYPGGDLAGRPSGGGEPWQTGDGTVPYEGARPSFLPPERLVAVTRDDFGYWELLDRGLTWDGVGLHGMLPRMSLVHRLVRGHLATPPGEPGRADRTMHGRPAPRLPDDPSAEEVPWQPPLEDLTEPRPPPIRPPPRPGDLP